MGPSKNQKSLNTHRLSRERLEKKFVMAWRKVNTSHSKCCGYGNHLRDLLIKDLLSNERPSDRDFQVAETVVQWLGSPVGQVFLSSVIEPETRNGGLD